MDFRQEDMQAIFWSVGASLTAEGREGRVDDPYSLPSAQTAQEMGADDTTREDLVKGGVGGNITAEDATAQKTCPCLIRQVNVMALAECHLARLPALTLA